MDQWFSIPMLLSYFVIWILWILLQIAIEVDLIWIIFGPLNFLFIANFIIGTIHHVKKKNNTTY